MLPSPALELLARFRHIDELLDLVARISHSQRDLLRSELAEQLAVRAFFLLMGHVQDAQNYDLLEQRISRLLDDPLLTQKMAPSLAAVLAMSDAADALPKATIQSLPYAMRQRILIAQGHRCAICGLDFHAPPPASRVAEECTASLDHRVPHRIGGESEDNLWILCALCNAIKGTFLHIAEVGRIWSNNTIYFDSRRVLAFWVLYRRRRCAHPDCARTPADGVMAVGRIASRGPWALDNCEPRCEQHATSDVLEY